MGQRGVRGVAAKRQSRSMLWRGRMRRSYTRRCVAAGTSMLAIALAVAAFPVTAGASASSVSPAVRAQARQLYAPASAYEHSTTTAQRARSRLDSRRVGRVIGACQAQYEKRLTTHPGNSAAWKLYVLWNHATLLQVYQADVNPVAMQTKTLAASWAALSLRNGTMNEFVHALAAELRPRSTRHRLTAAASSRRSPLTTSPTRGRSSRPTGFRRRAGGRRSARRATARARSGYTSAPPDSAAHRRQNRAPISSPQNSSSCCRTFRVNSASPRPRASARPTARGSRTRRELRPRSSQ